MTRYIAPQPRGYSTALVAAYRRLMYHNKNEWGYYDLIRWDYAQFEDKYDFDFKHRLTGARALIACMPLTQTNSVHTKMIWQVFLVERESSPDWETDSSVYPNRPLHTTFELLDAASAIVEKVRANQAIGYDVYDPADIKLLLEVIDVLKAEQHYLSSQLDQVCKQQAGELFELTKVHGESYYQSARYCVCGHTVEQHQTQQNDFGVRGICMVAKCWCKNYCNSEDYPPRQPEPPRIQMI